MVTTHHRLPSKKSWMLLIPRTNGWASSLACLRLVSAEDVRDRTEPFDPAMDLSLEEPLGPGPGLDGVDEFFDREHASLYAPVGLSATRDQPGSGQKQASKPTPVAWARWPGDRVVQARNDRLEGINVLESWPFPRDPSWPSLPGLPGPLSGESTRLTSTKANRCQTSKAQSATRGESAIRSWVCLLQPDGPTGVLTGQANFKRTS